MEHEANSPSFKGCLYKILFGAGEIVQWMRALAALAEDLGLVPSTLMATHDHLQPISEDLRPSSGPLGTRVTNTYTQKIKINL